VSEEIIEMMEGTNPMEPLSTMKILLVMGEPYEEFKHTDNLAESC